MDVVARFPHEPFYGHRVPPYRCPACDGGVLLLMRDTLHFGETAESRMLGETVGPEIGAGRWRFSCLFKCCDADCAEVVACVGTMSWARDPRLPRDDAGPAVWAPGMGPVPDLDEQQRRAQAELAHRFQPLVFVPPVVGCVEEATAREVRVADDFTWMDVGGVRYSFRPGRQADSIRVLYQAWIDGGRRDGSGVPEKLIGEQIESGAGRFRVDRVFEGHQILHRILRTPGKGQWALYFASASGSEPSQDVDAA
jgi:hypothetical protein